ncbi:MAG: hypothetical protein B7Z76_11960 [Acidiphilium sp. 20-67-58]|jgi:hypothetical protein|nr:MAG: hypothetical protein B7Z76_11960 [Acidiphilium sp. 20-67-58]
MRRIIRLVEGIYDDDLENDEDRGSFGWWIWPNGELEECPDAGTHVDLTWEELDQDFEIVGK